MTRISCSDAALFVAPSGSIGTCARDAAAGAVTQAQPVAFGAAMGYLHPAQGAVGVVFCSGWGYEELCAHRACVEFAEATAAAGYPTLRFDYPGAGDAAGDIADHTLDSWIATVSDAAALLREQTGVRDVALAGFGFGCLVALEAAARGLDANGLVLLAPPQTGRRWVRETQAFAAMVAAEHDGGDAVENGALSIAGFVMPAAFAAQARKLDATRFAPPPTAFVLIAARPEEGADALARPLAANGAEIRAIPFEGYSDILAGPTTAETPTATFARIVEALRDLRPAGDSGRPTTPAPGPAFVAGEGYVEEALRFGDGGRLFGVLCRPDGAAAGAPAGGRLNGGRNPHTGWRRMAVEHARSLAREGIASLRFDIGGIGESAPRTGQPRQLLYTDWPTLDVFEALDLMTARGYGPITLSGVCSGAYVAMQVAVADARVAGAVMVNLYRLVWDSAESVENALRFANRPIAAAVTRLFTRERFMAILAGKVDLRPGVMHALKRLRRWFGVATMSWAGPLGPRSAIYAECMRRFGILRARRVQTALCYSAGDEGLNEIDDYFGTGGRRLSAYPDVRVDVIEQCDHNITPPRASVWLVNQIVQVVAATQRVRG